MLISVLVVAEIFVLCTAAFLVFRTRGNPFAESASYAVISVFMLLSFLLQLSLITGTSIPFSTIEALCVQVSLVLILRNRTCVFTTWSTIKDFGSKNPPAPVFLGACFLVMAVHAFLPVPEAFQTSLTILSPDEKIGVSGTLPMNHLILFQTFLRFNTHAGAGIFCVLAYFSIGFSTYALARRYSWPPTAFTTAILVMSMPRLVVQAMFPGTETLSIAIALFCILALYRSVELPNPMDLIFLILGLFFCVSQNIAGMIFGLIFFVLSWVVLFRRHGMIQWKQILGKNYLALLAVVPAAIFSQPWFFLSDAFGSRFSEISDISFNPDGIQGALANLIRYMFESLYFSAPLDLIFNGIFNPPQFPAGSFLGEMGAAQIFHLAWPPDQVVSFGPTGFFLVVPALVYALIKAPRRLKAVAIAFCIYLYMVCLIIAWAPDNAKFLSLFYVCSGFSISFFLPPWRFTKGFKRIFQAGACLILLLSLLTAL